MNNTSAIRARSRLALYVLAGFFMLAPAASHAATNVATHQILPPNQQTCPVVGATDITPYIYDGALNSFDITVSDASYVAIGAQVGDTPLSFNYITRYDAPNGAVRIHVDVPTTQLVSDTPITVSLASAHPQGSPITCIASVSTVLPAVPQQGSQAPTPVPHTPDTTAYTAPSARPQVPSYPWTHISYAQPKPVQQPVVVPVKQPVATATAPLVTATHSLGNACVGAGAPARLWTILLVLYAAFVWLLTMLRGKSTDATDWNVALVVAGFLGLLFFWYVSAACRTGSWAPILATIIACAGLIALTQSVGKAEETPLLLTDPKKS